MREKKRRKKFWLKKTEKNDPSPTRDFLSLAFYNELPCDFFLAFKKKKKERKERIKGKKNKERERRKKN